MTSDVPIPGIEYRGYRLFGVCGRTQAEDVRDVVRMWIDAGVLAPAEAQRRIAELVVVTRAPDGQLAGVSTAYVADVPGERGAWYFYRTFLRSEHRGVAGVPTRMLRLALDELRAWRHPQAPRGVVIITENPKLMRRAAKARIEALGLNLLGSDERGCDVWCLKFDGTVPVAPPWLRPPAAT